MQVTPDSARPISFLSPLGYQVGSCGYCKGTESSCSYYVRAKSFHVEHYQAMVDRGWRRSGTLVYKPDPRVSCCPHYTIRLPVADFKPRKDQRKALNRWNRFVTGEKYDKESARIRPRTKAEKLRDQQEFELGRTVHEAQYDTLPKPPEPDHRFKVNLEPDDFTQEKFALYEEYQRQVHKDVDSSPNGFKGFLCQSPLNRSKRMVDGVEQHLGSFHQCYRLDGRLIAMGVLDLLPHGVSGVYFIYHPEFEKYSFGKISALTEATLAKEGRYGHYYMGYYIHSCPKMRYKNEYKPQFFLDQETNTWDPLDDEARLVMDRKKYVSMSQERGLRLADGEGGEKSNHASPGSHGVRGQQTAFTEAGQAADAYQSGISLFDIGLPGMMSASELEDHMNLDLIPVQVPSSRRKIVPAAMLTAWDDGDIHDPLNLKGSIAEMIACVGPEVAKGLVVTFAP